MIKITSVETYPGGKGRLVVTNTITNRRAFFSFNKYPKDINLLQDQVIEISNHALYLSNDEMFAWRTGGDGIDFLDSELKNLLSDRPTQGS
jgi:hypothetical protein